MKTTQHPHVAYALHALKLYKRCGRFAAQRYLELRGIPLALLRIVRQLDAMARAGWEVA